MAYNSLSFDTRISENIKDYTIANVMELDVVKKHIQAIVDCINIGILLTDRHGEVVYEGGYGDVELGEQVDVETDPGIKIRVRNRTVAHMYTNTDKVDAALHEYADSLCRSLAQMLEELGEKTYYSKEASIYVDVLENLVKQSSERRKGSEKEDPLTGVLNQVYFNKRAAILDRSQIAPVAVIEANINDWKYANDNYGDEGSDRLIRIIASIIKNNAKPEYVVGRIDGDVFAILIPMPEDGEAESYVAAIQLACNTYEDPCLSPSIACGIAYKGNVEETIENILSDAEYLMFGNKLDIKNSPEYQARLHRS